MSWKNNEDNLDLLLYQITTGVVRCEVNGEIYYVCRPSPEDRMEAAFIKNETVYDCNLKDVLGKDSLFDFLIKNNLWSIEEEGELNGLLPTLDGLKEQMYNFYVAFKSKKVEAARRQLEKNKDRITQLSKKRSIYDNYTAEGAAELYQLQYLIYNNVKKGGKKVNLDDFPDSFFTVLFNSYLNNKPTEYQTRQLAKYSKWRMIWASGRQEGRVFGVPSVELTEEQSSLIGWSKLYDNISEHPEPPPEAVIEDDDLLDGWIIVENKKQKEKNKGVDTKTKGDEQFIVVDSQEDADRVYKQNDIQGKIIQKQRLEAANRAGGRIREQDTPDGIQRIRTKAVQQMRDKHAKK